jgi:methionyl-tRNA formyltransferase
MISAGKPPIAQSGTGTLAPKIGKEEAKIDWSQSSVDVVNLVRAFTPAPGAWTLWRGEKFHLTECKSSLVKLPAGEIALIEGSLLVGCGDSAIEMITVIPFGKSAMKGADWARGARLVAGDHFE